MNENNALNYCWRHKLLSEPLATTDGLSVDIIDQGLYDRREGSTFFNAKVRIGGTLYVGNVITLLSASDWGVRHYDNDSKYDNVILVVSTCANAKVVNSKGESIPVLQAAVPKNVRRNFYALLGMGGDILCHHHIMQYTTPLIRHAWLSAMQTEFLEEESEYLKRFYEESGKSLEHTFLCAVLRGFGFVVNKVTMDLLARNTSLQALETCRDDLFQIEAILMGQAGLLDQRAVIKDALLEGYFTKLLNEWNYLKHKYGMPWSLSYLSWGPYGKGGLTYPHVYLSMIANWWYFRRTAKASLNIKTAKEAMDFFNTSCTAYWETHNSFGATSKKSEKRLSDDRKAWLVMAALVPFMFFYGRLTFNEELCDRAFDIMEQTKAFSTAETNHFRKNGLVASDAGEALALTHLKTAYCCQQAKPGADPRECFRCRFGFSFIKKH